MAKTQLLENSELEATLVQAEACLELVLALLVQLGHEISHAGTG